MGCQWKDLRVGVMREKWEELVTMCAKWEELVTMRAKWEELEKMCAKWEELVTMCANVLCTFCRRWIEYLGRP